MQAEVFEAVMVESVQATIRSLKSLNENRDSGNVHQGFVISDDNNLIEIGEKLEVFIQRLNNDGLSTEQIHKKTGVPQDQILNIISK